MVFLLLLVASKRQLRISILVFASFKSVEVILHSSCSNTVKQYQTDEVWCGHQSVEDIGNSPYL